MLFDEVMERIRDRQQKIVSLEMEQQIDMQLLHTSGVIDTDLISINMATQKYSVSRTQIDYMINTRAINRYDRVGKIFLSKNELEKALLKKEK